MKYKMTGIVLRVMRKEMDMTQLELGDWCGIDKQYVSNWERGICMPRPQDIKKIELLYKKHFKQKSEQARQSLKQSYLLDCETKFESKYPWK